MRLPSVHRRKRQVNLLPKDDFENSVFGVILTWALSFGKWSVILTQLVVALVFLTRFGYDRQLTDLRKNIAKQAAIVSSYNEIEQNYRITQKRAQQIAPIMSEQARMLAILDKLEAATPSDVWYERMTVGAGITSIAANAASLPGFSQFVRNISSDEMFKSVSINSLQDGAQQGARLQFDMTLNYAEAKK